MKKILLLLFFATVAIGIGPLSTNGQTCDPPPTLSEYVVCEVRRIARERIMRSDDTRQVEAPAASPNSTTLVNRSSAPDTIGISITPDALASRSRASRSTDISTTISLYFLHALVSGRNPYDESFYDNNTSKYRRFSFTYGRSYPEGRMSVPAQGSHTFKGKFLLSASRDVGDPSNRGILSKLVDNLRSGTSQAYAQTYGKVEDYLLRRFGRGRPDDEAIPELRDAKTFPAILGQFTDEDRKEIQRIIEERIESDVQFQRLMDDIIREIQRRPQFAVSFTMRKSKGIGSNLYRSEFIMDNKLPADFSSTLNMSYDFSDALSSTGVNRHIGRLVGEIQRKVGKPLGLPAKQPLSIAISGEGNWGSNSTPLYRGQFKITIPLISGLNIPLSFTIANRTSVPLADVKGQMAITADFGKLSRAFATR